MAENEQTKIKIPSIIFLLLTYGLLIALAYFIVITQKLNDNNEINDGAIPGSTECNSESVSDLPAVSSDISVNNNLNNNDNDNINNNNTDSSPLPAISTGHEEVAVVALLNHTGVPNRPSKLFFQVQWANGQVTWKKY